MTEVTCPVNCGNSPRAAMLRDFNIAFAMGNIDALLAEMDETIRWEMVGDQTIVGKQAVGEALRKMIMEPTAKVEIKAIITHGKLGAADGSMVFADGTQIAFCDVYVFSSPAPTGKLKEMRSYAKDVA